MSEEKPKRGRPPRKPLEPLPLSPEEEAHVRKLHERMDGALDLEQCRAAYRLSRGMPDANGRASSSREQLGGLNLLLGALLPKPKQSPEVEAGATIVLRNPFAACPKCGYSPE